MKKNTF